MVKEPEEVAAGLEAYVSTVEDPEELAAGPEACVPMAEEPDCRPYVP